MKCSAHSGVTVGNTPAYSTVLFLTLHMKGYRYFVAIYGNKILPVVLYGCRNLVSYVDGETWAEGV